MSKNLKKLFFMMFLLTLPSNFMLGMDLRPFDELRTQDDRAPFVTPPATQAMLRQAEEEEGEVSAPRQLPTVTQWAEACNRRLGRYKFTRERRYPKYSGNFATPLSKEDFEYVIGRFVETVQGSRFNNPANWLISKKFIVETTNERERTQISRLNKIILASEQSNQEEQIVTPGKRIRPEPTDPDKIIPNPSIFDENATRVWRKMSERKNLFAQRLIVNNDTHVAIIADLHGDAHSLIKYVEDLKNKAYLDDNFRIIRDLYIVFTGDYSDRGPNGAEALYTAMRLKIANPDRVIMLRGNHESFSVNMKAGTSTSGGGVGFTKELQNKFRYYRDDFIKKIVTVYDLLPSALYIGTPDAENIINYALICHGGPDIRFDPRPLLSYPEKRILYQKIDYLNGIKNNECWLRGKRSFFIELEKIRFITSHENKWFIDVPANGNYPERSTNSFAWADFIVGQEGKIMHFKRGGARGFSFGEPLITGLLEACRDDYTYKLRTKIGHALGAQYRLRTIIRGHQHNGNMSRELRKNHGIYNSWTPIQWNGTPGAQLSLTNSPVWTILVSPESIYGRYEGKNLNDLGTLVHDYNCGTYAILKLQQQFENWRIEPVKIKIFKTQEEIEIEREGERRRTRRLLQYIRRRGRRRRQQRQRVLRQAPIYTRSTVYPETNEGTDRQDDRALRQAGE